MTDEIAAEPKVDEKPAAPQAVPDVVAHLADMLHRATRGKIVSIATAAIERDTRLPIIGWGAHNGDTTNDLVAAVGDLEFALRDMRAERSFLAPRAAPGQPTEASDGASPGNAAGTAG